MGACWCPGSAASLHQPLGLKRGEHSVPCCLTGEGFSCCVPENKRISRRQVLLARGLLRVSVTSEFVGEGKSLMSVFWAVAALLLQFVFACPLGCSWPRQDQLSTVV